MQSQENVSQSQLLALTETLTRYLMFSLSVVFLPGLIIVFFVILCSLSFSRLLHNLPSDWLEKMAFCYSYLFGKLQYLFICSVILGNMAINSFVTAFMLEHCPLSTGSYLISPSYVVQNILQISSF